MDWISVDRGNKVTLPLTMPRREFKLSAKDSACRPFKTSLQGVRRGLYAPRKEATSVSRPWGIGVPYFGTLCEQRALAPHLSMDSDLEAFSRNPAHGSFALLAFQPSVMTNCVNQRFLSTSSESVIRRPGKSPEGNVPSPSPSWHAATRSPHDSSSSSSPTVDGFGIGTLVPSPQSQSFSQSYGLILSTSLANIAPSTRGCSPWRPDAVMSTTRCGGTRPSGFSRDAGAHRTLLDLAPRGALRRVSPVSQDRLTHVQVPFTWNISPLRPSKFSFEYLLLRPRSAPAAALRELTLGFCGSRRALLLIET
ncbi:hypothetical protein AXF42_Ash001453 [Apostasia shenzhenica]|uniref:Uncharacterized protein n=1 Tax=Apostasia shenzhenica TaxID=1088818 RepID=A0A2I0AUZ5_9ASPA|nr:hypothetical protein AXF42_Ash001453 [Apostasia shenzhenica]